MTDEDRALGERWLKAGGGWCVGMTSPAVGNNTFHVIALDNEGVPVEWLVTRNYDGPSAIVTAYGRPGWAWEVWADQVPDFGNPAVRGLALDVLRKRWKGDIWIGVRLTAAARARSVGARAQRAGVRVIDGERAASRASTSG